VLDDPSGNVSEFFPGLGAKINVTQALNLAPSLYASVAFTSSGQVLVLTQQDGSVLQFTLANGQGSIGSVTQALNLGPSRAASVAVNNGVEFLVITKADGNVIQVTSNGGGGVLTQVLSQLASPQTPVFVVSALSVTEDFNPFSGQEVLVETNVNGVVLLFTQGAGITLMGVQGSPLLVGALGLLLCTTE
jgi:hypothetical protein